MTASAFMRLAYWIMFQFFLFLTPELASKLLPSKSRNGGPVFCVFTRSWSIVVGFAVWEVGCLRAGFNASGRVCHRCVHTELDDVPAFFFLYSLLKSSQASYLPTGAANADQCFCFDKNTGPLLSGLLFGR